MTEIDWTIAQDFADELCSNDERAGLERIASVVSGSESCARRIISKLPSRSSPRLFALPDGLPVARIALTADHLARCDSRTQPAFVAGDVANTLWGRAKDAPAPTPPLLDGLTPWEQRASRALHACLYLLLIGSPVSGYLISKGSSIGFFGWAIAPAVWAEPSRVALAIHAWALPALFYAALALHIGAVLKRHFGDRDVSAVRRMLR